MAMYCNNFEFNESRDDFLLNAEPPETFAMYPNSNPGPPGPQGPPGPAGPGVAEGGTTGQLLAKASDEDYDTEWIDPPELDAGHVTYDDTETYEDGTVGDALASLNSAFDLYNLFDGKSATIISVMGNANGNLVSGGGVSSVAIPVDPSTQYTVSFWGGDRRLLWETESYPEVGGTWVVNDGEMTVSGEVVDGKNRYKKTITTGSTTHYLLLYFYTNSTGAEDVPQTIQVEKGSVMHKFGLFTMPLLEKDTTLTMANAVPDSKTVGDIIAELPKAQKTNFFDKSSASIVSIAVNATTLAFVTGGGVSSVIMECDPSTTYTIAWRSVGSYSRFKVGTSVSIPVVGDTATSLVDLSSIAADGRHYGTLTTGQNDNYLLLWFYADTTGGESALDSIQVNLGNDLLEYTGYGFISPGLNLSTEKLYGSPLDLTFLPLSAVNVMSYRQLGNLDKGYICLVADDGTSDVGDVSFTIAQNKNVPITFALWSTSYCITDQTLFEQLQTMISDYGCSVAQHGVGNFATGYTVASLQQYLDNEVTAWESIGITPDGMVYPNHEHNNYVRVICGSRYGVCCTGGASGNKDHVYPNDTLGTRSNIFALYRVSIYSTSEATLKTMCDYAYANNKLLIIWWHDSDIADDASQIAKINNVIDYAKTKGLEFINVGDIQRL